MGSSCDGDGEFGLIDASCPMRIEAMPFLLSSRPERSVVEGSVVRPSDSPILQFSRRLFSPCDSFLRISCRFTAAGAKALTIFDGYGTTEVVP